MGIFWGILIACVAGGVLGVLISRLTAAVVKSYRKRRNTKVVAASMKAIAREAVNSPQAAHIKMSDLDCDSMIMEYDPSRDEIVHSNRCAETDPLIQRHMSYGQGMVVYED